MRKKKKETAPAPVETDFYTEALKAFDVVLPPTQEELEAQRREAEEKARKRVWYLRAAILAVVVVTVALLLWRPWNSLGEPQPTLPPYWESIMSDTKLTFHVYTVPGSYGVSMVPTGGTVELTKEQMDSLLQRLEALKWSSSAILSSIPPAPIGDFTFTRDGQQYQVRFNGYGTLFAEMYMAKPDTALWNDLFTLLQQQSEQAPIGRFGTELVDGSGLYLDIQKDGSFVVMKEQGIEYSGYWGMVDDYLLLYTSEPRTGFAVLRVGDDGGMAYLETHDLWLLKELKGQPPLYPVSDATNIVATMTVQLSMPGEEETSRASALLTQAKYRQLVALLEKVEWGDMIISGYVPAMCGKVQVKEKSSDGMTQAISIQFNHAGMIYDGLRYGKLSDADWMAFVEILSGVEEARKRIESFYSQEEGKPDWMMVFARDEVFVYQNGKPDTNQACKYLSLGDLILLAGPEGLRDLFKVDGETGDLISVSGEVFHYSAPIYGDA